MARPRRLLPSRAERGRPGPLPGYVGEVGRRNLLLRLKEHAGQKDWWSRASLITSVSDDFNSAEIGWLEGRLCDPLKRGGCLRRHEPPRPGDDSLASHQRALLERYVGPMAAALRACGAPPDTAAQAAPPPDRDEADAAALQRENRGAGRRWAADRREQFVSVRRALSDVRGTIHRDGSVLLDGIRHPSLSAAARVAACRARPGVLGGPTSRRNATAVRRSRRTSARQFPPERNRRSLWRGSLVPQEQPTARLG